MRALVLCLLVGLLAPSAAFANDREEAAREFGRGQAADKRRDWTAAIEHYKRANELLPHPYAIYNIAVDYERLGRFRDAATWFDAYLDAAPSANDRERVNKKILDLRNKPAKLVVRSHPTGATVKIQGLPAGSTPLTTEREGGIYRIVVEKGGDRDARDITVEYGEPVEIDVQLRDPGPTAPPRTDPTVGTRTEPRVVRPQKGTLVITGQPEGAFVSVDNEPAGTLPLRVPLDAGRHTVQVRAQGYQPYQSYVDVIPDRDVTVDVRMPHALGHLQATPKPKANIYYFLGAAGGVETRGETAEPVVLGELGLRGNRYDTSIRMGSIAGTFAFDIALRYGWFDARFTPFVGGGYSYVREGLGWELLGGFRLDVTRKAGYGVALVAEAQLRWYAQSDDSSSATAAEAQLAIPIIGSLQILYR